MPIGIVGSIGIFDRLAGTVPPTSPTAQAFSAAAFTVCDNRFMYSSSP